MTTSNPAPASSLVAAAAGRMRLLAAALPERDGVAVFTRVYLAVTGELARRVDAGWFRHPHRTAALGAAFAARYLSAVEADAEGRVPPACWRPLFAARHLRTVRPLQFALAGVNAHVGHDLALAVVDTCVLLGVEPEGVRSDFDRVGEVLADVEERVREQLMPGPDPLERADPLTHLAGVWTLDAARSAAWSAAGLLWRLREHPGLRAEFAAGLDSGVGWVNRCLLTPL